MSTLITEPIIENISDEDAIKAIKQHKKEIVMKSRKKNVAQYNATCLAYYNRKKHDDEWRLKRNEQCKLNMRRYHERKKLKKLLEEEEKTV
jgi:hypothetical protein